ncbi:hypothetical protein NL108_017049 [Boleophthalmus pectinirostris]|uniref:uncharacterized protein LOC110158310 n=1 Tax=Boleophthalmus pectinirostris TaxID=150288 RepID=UPI00242C2995|nr:uncharacterized protein LOC110158310 [Boleophthalmus pectinirostris]KAJ0055970.1 hypothetical protein NL108_017049 [Boleophthalmus pectinirostris]
MSYVVDLQSSGSHRRGNCTDADMLGVRSAYFIVLFSCNALLLLGIYSHALEVSSCQTEYGREGGTIVLSPETINETITKGQWKYNEKKIADSKADITGHQFSGRETMDKTNYSLTLKELKTTDSGDFTFISQGTSRQRPTYCIKLVVQEVLTSTPTVAVINTTQTTNSSCVVLTQCSSEFHKDVSYRWTVNNRNYNGPMLEYPLTSQDGTITVKCIVSNKVSEVSESKSINCQSTNDKKGSPLKDSLLIVVAAGLGCVILVSAIASVVYCRNRKKQAELDEVTVYAEIDDVTSSKVMKPCSLYDSVDMKMSTAKHKPQTVYDQIQFNRMQK